MINLLAIFSNFNNTLIKIAIIIAIALVIIACIKWKNGRLFIFTALFIALLASALYCGIQLDTYYSSTGGIYGKLTSMYKPNTVEIVSSVEYSFNNVTLMQDDGDTYSARISSNCVLELAFDENTNYGVYVNNMPCSYVEIANDYVIAKYIYLFEDENFNDIICDTLTFKFAFYTNSTYLVVTTDGGANAVKYWNYYFNKNVFNVTIDNKGYAYNQDINFGNGDISDYSIVTYYLNDELYLKQVYKNGNTLNIPNNNDVGTWLLNDSLVEESYIVNSNINIYGYYNYGLNLEYSQEDSGYVVLGLKYDKSDVTIPSAYNDGINGKANVTSIGFGAFKDCTSLINISIPSSVTTIGNYAFHYCENLTNVNIQSGLTSIGFYAFQGCTNLTNITIPSSVTIIQPGAFDLCSSLTDITIPLGITTIYDYTFRATGLTSITIPSSITKISRFAFHRCTSLTNVIFENSTGWCKTSNSDYTDGEFVDDTETANLLASGRYYLYQTILPSDWISYDDTTSTYKVIAGTSELPSNFVLPSTYDDGTNGKASVTTIDREAFKNCTSLINISIPSSVTSIGIWAFYNCTSLTSITIPKSVTSIGAGPFRSCSNLTSIVVEEGNTVYDSRNNCNAIIETATNTLMNGCNNTIIPSDITTISTYAFERCTSLTNIIIPSSVTSIEKHIFNGCTNLTSIVVEEGNTVYDSRNNCNALIETSSNTLLRGCCSTIIPFDITTIESYAFSGSAITNIIIPANITTINNGVFKDCVNLIDITFEEGQLTTIGNYEFQGCTSLTSITIPANITTIGISSFQGCTNLTNVIISEGVTTILSSAFKGCTNLTSITLPSTINNISALVFSDCTSLTSITMLSTTPPTLKSASAIPSSVTTIYIPSGTLEAYSSASYWSTFADKFVELES